MDYRFLHGLNKRTSTVITVTKTQSISGGGYDNDYVFDLSDVASEVLGVRSVQITGQPRLYITKNGISISGTTLTVNVQNNDSTSNITLTMDVSIVAK